MLSDNSFDDSDIDLTINGNLYHLHKNILIKSIFFKSLIDYIELMSTKEDIEIFGINGEKIQSEYIDNIIEWLYNKGNNLIENLADNGEMNDFKKIIQYYYLSDFLQIDEIKRKTISVMNCKLSSYNGPSNIVENMSVCDYKYCDVFYGAHNRSQFCSLMEIFYGELTKIIDLYKEECDKIKNIDKPICNRYMNFVLNREKEKFVSLGEVPNNNYSWLMGEIYKIYKYFYGERHSHCNFLVKKEHELHIKDIKILLNVVHKSNHEKLVQLLDMNIFYANNKIDWEKMMHFDNICIEYGVRDTFLIKMNMFIKNFVYD